MRIGLTIAWVLAVAGCNDVGGTRGIDTTTPDLAFNASDMTRTAPPGADLALPGAGDDHSDLGVGTLGDGGTFHPPSDMGSVMHAPPGTLAGVVNYGAGSDFRD